MKPLKFKFRCTEIRAGEDERHKPTHTIILAAVSSEYLDPTVPPEGRFHAVLSKEAGLRVGDEVWVDVSGVVGN